MTYMAIWAVLSLAAAVSWTQTNEDREAERARRAS